MAGVQGRAQQIGHQPNVPRAPAAPRGFIGLDRPAATGSAPPPGQPPLASADAHDHAHRRPRHQAQGRRPGRRGGPRPPRAGAGPRRRLRRQVRPGAARPAHRRGRHRRGRRGDQDLRGPAGRPRGPGGGAGPRRGYLSAGGPSPGSRGGRPGPAPERAAPDSPCPPRPPSRSGRSRRAPCSGRTPSTNSAGRAPRASRTPWPPSRSPPTWPRTAARGRALARAKAVAGAVRWTRDLVNTPPNHLPPAVFAEAARAEAEATGVGFEVLDEKALARGGYGGILGVGQGSANPPRLVRLAHRPAGATRHLALVGKGITFDSGGISIKPAQGMQTMKSDIAGDAAVWPRPSPSPASGCRWPSRPMRRWPRTCPAARPSVPQMC